MQVEWIIVFGSGGHANVAREGILTRSRGRLVLILDDPAADGRTVLTTCVSAARDRLINNMPDAPVAFSIGSYCACAELLEWHDRTLGGWRRSLKHRRSSERRRRSDRGASRAAGPSSLPTRGSCQRLSSAPQQAWTMTVLVRRRSMSRPACDCAETRVGAHTRPGVGSAVPPGIRAAADVHAGAASALVCDIPDGVVVGDCPAPLFKQAGDPA